MEYLFDLHVNMNSQRETEGSIKDPKDVTSIYKVDTHIHLAAAMTVKQVTEFIEQKAKMNKDVAPSMQLFIWFQ